MDYKVNKYATFLVFVILSFTLWFVYRYQENFSQTTTVFIEFTNVPDHITFDTNEAIPVKVNLTSSGFRLLKARYFPPIITMDYLKSVESIDGIVSIDLNKNIFKLKEGIGGDFVLNNANQEIVEIPVTILQSKKVKINFNPEIIYKNNLVPVEKGFTIGDSLLISGDHGLLDRIDYLDIEGQEIVVSQTFEQLPLDLGKILPDGIVVSNVKLLYEIHSVQMTEGSIDIVIDIKNLPENIAVKIIPSTISVVYTVPLEDYDLIRETDFSYNITYEQLTESVNIIPVEITTNSDLIHSVRTVPSQIKILVIR